MGETQLHHRTCQGRDTRYVEFTQFSTKKIHDYYSGSYSHITDHCIDHDINNKIKTKNQRNQFFSESLIFILSPLSSIFLFIKKNHKKTLKLNYDLNCQYEMKITDFGKISLNFSSLNLFSWT